MSDRNETKEWLDSDGGSGMMTLVAVVMGIGFVVWVVLSLEGWARIAAIVVAVLSVLTWVYFRFFHTPKE